MENGTIQIADNSYLGFMWRLLYMAFSLRTLYLLLCKFTRSQFGCRKTPFFGCQKHFFGVKIQILPAMYISG